MTLCFMEDPTQWRRINTLLDEVLELPQHQHERWHERIATEQPDVAVVLRTLLAGGSAENDSFISQPVATVWAQACSAAGAGDAPGQSIGPYRLLRELGTGGMGTVWLAERADGVPQRKVALKLPLYGWAPG